MATLYEMSTEEQREWDAWVAERPSIVQELAQRFPWNILYRMKSTGQRCTIVSYNEDGTLRVFVSAKYNFVLFEREVFGIHPDDLEETDEPQPDECAGALLEDPEEIQDAITILRPVILGMRDAN
jgi:hypothetical protein